MSERLGYLLKRAQHALRTSIDDQLSPLGLTTAQYNLLSAVAFEPGISNAALARMAFVTAQSMQGVIANMEKQGLLRRVPHPTHGRIRRSELTRRGAEILAKAHKVLIGIEERMTEGFDQAEIEDSPRFTQANWSWKWRSYAKHGKRWSRFPPFAQPLGRR